MRRVVAAGAAVFVVGALADWYSVAHHLPYGLGGHGQPNRVAQDWPSHGTALGPPLLPFIAVLLATPLATARRWWGGIGSALLMLVGLAELWGTLAEPSSRVVFTPATFDATQIAFRLATLIAVTVLLLATGLDLYRRLTPSPQVRCG